MLGILNREKEPGFLLTEASGLTSPQRFKAMTIAPAECLITGREGLPGNHPNWYKDNIDNFTSMASLLGFEARLQAMSSEHQSRSTSLISVEDLTGLGVVGARIVDAVELALGALWRRARLKEEADAEDYRITALARAEAERRRLLSEVEKELAERAEHRLLGQEIQREKNLEVIIKEAIKLSIENDQRGQDRAADDETIDPDWMARFRNLSQDISHPDMQTVWGRLLEDEARKPGKYSIRALENLSNMRRADAALFQRNLSSSL